MPHAGQRYVREHRRRTTWLSAGRRWRKTTLCVALMVEAALTGETVIWGAPTYDQVWTAWEETRRACGNAASFNQGRMTATLGYGAMLFRSLDDPDNARSKTANGIVIDEAADVAHTAYTEVLLPMLMDTGGWLIAAGTPKGRNWFWRECMAALEGTRPDSILFQAPSLGVKITDAGLVRERHPLENPLLAFAEIERLYHTMTERSFRQEILAEFIEDGAGVFRGVRACVGNSLEKAQAQAYYVAGLDWGKLNDATVLTMMDANKRSVVAIERWVGIDYRHVLERIAAICQDYRPVQIVAERNSMGEPLIEHLQYEYRLPVVPFTTSNQSKADLIEGLALAFERSSITIPDLPWLRGEIEAFERTRTSGLGLPSYSAPEGMHDDGVMSLALAWSAVRWVFGGQV